MWEVLVSGALRTGERLHRADIKYKGTNQTIEAECKLCGSNEIEDLEHIFVKCSCYNKSRDEFREILGLVAASAANPEERRIISDPAN